MKNAILTSLVALLVAASVAHAIGTDYDAFVKRRARILMVSRWGAGLAGFSKGIVDAQNWGGSGNVVYVGKWWHAADVSRTVGTVMAVVPLVYGVAHGELTWGEAVRYGVGCTLHADLVFKMTYHSVRYGCPIDLRPEHNVGMIQYPWFGGDKKINATHWYYAALHRSVLYFGGSFLKRSVEQGHGLLWPLGSR